MNVTPGQCFAPIVTGLATRLDLRRDQAPCVCAWKRRFIIPKHQFGLFTPRLVVVARVREDAKWARIPSE